MSADTHSMTLFRRPVATKRRRRIIDVTNYWRTDAGPVPLREVIVADYDGQIRRTYLPDGHPSLVAWFDRLAAA